MHENSYVIIMRQRSRMITTTDSVVLSKLTAIELSNAFFLRLGKLIVFYSLFTTKVIIIKFCALLTLSKMKDCTLNCNWYFYYRMCCILHILKLILITAQMTFAYLLTIFVPQLYARLSVYSCLPHVRSRTREKPLKTGLFS